MPSVRLNYLYTVYATTFLKNFFTKQVWLFSWSTSCNQLRRDNWTAASLLGMLSAILSMTKFFSFWRSFNLFSTLEALPLQLRQTYAGSPSSFVTATRNISPPWIVNNPLACLASTSERQKRHSQVVTNAHHQLSSFNLATHHLPSLLPEISVPGDLGDLPAHHE